MATGSLNSSFADQSDHDQEEVVSPPHGDPELHSYQTDTQQTPLFTLAEYIAMERRLMQHWIKKSVDVGKADRLLVRLWLAIFGKKLQELCHAYGLEEVERKIWESHEVIQFNIAHLFEVQWNELKSPDATLQERMVHFFSSVQSTLQGDILVARNDEGTVVAAVCFREEKTCASE